MLHFIPLRTTDQSDNATVRFESYQIIQITDTEHSAKSFITINNLDHDETKRFISSFYG